MREEGTGETQRGSRMRKSLTPGASSQSRWSKEPCADVLCKWRVSIGGKVRDAQSPDVRVSSWTFF